MPVYELGLDRSEHPYFSMKLVKGETLSAQLCAPQPIRPRTGAASLGVFEQICQTMAYAHARHVVHRDLKPANVMIGSFGEVQVVDWGFAKVLASGGRRRRDRRRRSASDSAQSIIETVRSDSSSGTHSIMGSMLGTPAYMPPEQAIGDVDRMDERSDVFGLGAILCEILTGQPPYIEADGDFDPASRARRYPARRSTASKRVPQTLGSDRALQAVSCHRLAWPDRPRPRKSADESQPRTCRSVEERARAGRDPRRGSREVRARSTLILSAVAILVLAIGGGGYYWLESEAAARRTHAEGLVATALQKANARLGEATASGFARASLPGPKVQSAAEEVERLAASEFVGDELKAKVADFVQVIATRPRKGHGGGGAFTRRTA